MRVSAAIIFIVLILGAGLGTQTYPAAAQEDACGGSEMLKPFVGDADFEKACQAFALCLQGSSFMACAPYFLSERFADCHESDFVCETQAKMHTGLIGLTQGISAQVDTLPDTFWQQLAAQIGSIRSMETLTFDQIAAWYLPLIEAHIEHPMLEYSLAALAELKERPEIAADLYDIAVSLNTNDPLIYWGRAQFFARQDDALRSAVDYLMMSVTGRSGVTEDSLDFLLSELHEGIAEIDERFYNLYPFLSKIDNESGLIQFDSSQEPAETIRLIILGETTALLINEIPSIQQQRENPMPVVLLLERSESEGWYSAGNLYYAGIRTETTLQARMEQVYFGVRRQTSAEGTALERYILTPEDMPDPRANLPRCPGSPMIMLAVGMQSVPAGFNQPLKLYSDFDAPTAFEVETGPVEIVEGPRCGRGGTWFRVRNDNIAGWIRENGSESTYEMIEF